MIRSEKHASFLNNLEQWVDLTISQNGMAEQPLIQRIKDSYKRSLQANIDHYKIMTQAAVDAGDKALTKRYTLMENIYKALVQ